MHIANAPLYELMLRIDNIFLKVSVARLEAIAHANSLIRRSREPGDKKGNVPVELKCVFAHFAIQKIMGINLMAGAQTVAPAMGRTVLASVSQSDKAFILYFLSMFSKDQKEKGRYRASDR